MPGTDDRTDEGSAASTSMPDFGDHVETSTFFQILDMDESEDERDFSKPLVFNFFDQAEETFGKMDQALSDRNLDELSSLGHFLKGSSATLGFTKVKDSCQIIQQYGHKLNVDGSPETNEEVCLKKISDALAAAKVDMKELEKLLRRFFNGDSSD